MKGKPGICVEERFRLLGACCLSSPLRDAPRGSVGAAIGGNAVGTSAREREQGGPCKPMIVSCHPDTPTNTTRPRCFPSSFRGTGCNAHASAALQNFEKLQ